MISKRTIEKVFETARVEEVIGDFVQLKKSGSNYKGLSPFTEERTPSFMVSPAKQIWKDFSSGKGGTVITFLMEHEQYSYPEAIKYIANKYNIEVEETERTQEQISQRFRSKYYGISCCQRIYNCSPFYSVTIEAKVSRAFTTSMEVFIDVWVDDDSGKKIKANEAIYTFVAVDSSGEKYKKLREGNDDQNGGSCFFTDSINNV